MVLRWSRLLVRWVVAVLVTLAVLTGLLVWRIAQGPVSLSFLAPHVSEALTVPRLGIKADISDVVLAWSEREQSLRLRLIEVRYRVEDERVALTVPVIDMGLSGPSLLRGVIAPRYLHASGIEARLVRDQEGRLQFGLPAAEQAQPEQDKPESALPDERPPERVAHAMFASVFDLLSRPRSLTDPFGQIDTISVLADRLIIEDWKLDQRWVVPGAQMVVQRGEGHAFATASGKLEWRGREVEVSANADYSAADRSARVSLRFDNIEPSDFADVIPELAPLAYLHAPLSGSLALTVTEDGRQLDLGFDLTAGAGSVQAPELFSGPLDLTGAHFKGLVEAASGQLHLDEAGLNFGDGFRLTFAGKVNRKPEERYGLDVKGQFFGLPTNGLQIYWPVHVARNARNWVTTHISKGQVPAGRFAASLTPEMLGGAAPIPREAVKLDFAFEGLEVDYLPPMIKLTAARGVATLDADELDLTVESAQAGALQLGPGHVRLFGWQAGDERADINATARGQSSAVLALIDQKPLGFPSKLGIKPASVGGDAVVRWRLRFPLIGNLKFDDISVTADADLTGLSMPAVTKGYDLSAGELKLKVDDKGLEGNGRAAINGVPLQIGWHQAFDAKAAVPARYSLKGRLDEPQRAALGYPMAPYIEGPVEATMQIEERRGGETAVGGEFDFTDAVLQVPEAYFTKPAGQAATGRMLLRTKAGQAVRFDTIEVNGPELAVRAKAVLPPGGGWAAEVAEFRHGANQVHGRLVFTKSGDAQIELRGKRYDLQPFMGDVFGGDAPVAETSPAAATAAAQAAPPPTAPPPTAPTLKPRLVLDLRFDEAVIDKNLEMRNLAVSARREPSRLEQVNLTGGFATTGGLTLTIAPQLDGRALNLKSDNAGAVLHFLGITDMNGGNMTVAARFDDAKPGAPLSGRMEMHDVRAVKAPFLARLLGVGSFTGLSNLLSGEGIVFERGEVPFHQKDGVLTLEQSRLQGPQLGITFAGTVDQNKDHINVSGTAVPAFVLNTILGKIPLLGDIFVGDGIIGVNFAVSGPRADPQFTVNPLSALAPGVLRGIFKAPTSDGDAPATQEARPGSPSPAPVPNTP